MDLKMVFYLINVANVVNMSQPGVRIGGGLHALIDFLFTRGLKSPKPHWDLKTGGFYLKGTVPFQRQTAPKSGLSTLSPLERTFRPLRRLLGRYCSESK